MIDNSIEAMLIDLYNQLKPEIKDKIISGKYELKLSIKKKCTKKSKLNNDKSDAIDFELINSEIDKLVDQISLHEYLRNNTYGKKCLSKLAKLRGVAILSSDNVDIICEKLVYGILGHKMVSESITSFNEKSRNKGSTNG